jgi:hypothetical protein
MNYKHILNEINRLKELKKKLLNLNNKFTNEQCSILDHKINDLEKQIYSSEIDKFENNYEELININFEKKREINKLLEDNRQLDKKIEELYIINKNKTIEIDKINSEIENNQKILDKTIINNNQLLLKIEDEKSKVFSNFNLIDCKNKKLDQLKILIRNEESNKYNYLQKFHNYFEINLNLLNEIDLLNIKIEEYKYIYKTKKNINKDINNLKKIFELKSIELNENKISLFEKIKNYDFKFINIYAKYLINKEKYNELNLLFNKNNELDIECKTLVHLNEYYENKIKEYLNLSLQEKISEKELLLIDILKINEKKKYFFNKLEKSINYVKKIDHKLSLIIKNLETKFKINNSTQSVIHNYVEKLIIDNTFINDTTLIYMLNTNGCNIILFNDYLKNIRNKSNGIVIDIEFYKKANYLEIESENNICENILKKGVMEGYLYSSKQFYKLFPDNKLLNIGGFLFTNSNINNNIYLKDFLRDNLYNKDFEYFINKFEILEMSINYSELSLFVFIGYRERGIDLINKINNYNQNFNLIVIINDRNNYDLIDKINCQNRIVYLTDDYGNDIIPTLIAYNDVRNKIKLNYIIKLQTKHNLNFFNNVIDYLLSKNLQVLINLLLESKMNTIGHPNYIGYIETDKFYNTLLMIKYQSYIDINKNFIGGTMFFCHKVLFDKIIDFIKNNNYRCYFVNNLYDTNSVNKLASPIHFLERLFGLII